KTQKLMATIHLAVLKTRQNSKGTYSIYVAVTHKRAVRYITTEYEIDDLYQFDNGTIVCRKDAKIMNQRLQYLLSEYQKKLDSITKQEVYTCSQIKDMFTGKMKAESLVTISEYMTERINRLRKENRGSYADMNVYTLSKILSILGDITLQSFSSDTIALFIKGMNNFK
ncbi:Arm DNA-binding domain-containing protein, partial [uncultured Bacteroides sp.]|uniref:Arm DNA-binding domain-containing protein n=1 Tax=uncultured Bacteroides sp. TaxID=162156 RepID=UPI0025EAC50F